MQPYHDTAFGRASNGVVIALAGASVKVFLHNAGLATIYASDEITPLANPLTADATGEYSFYTNAARLDIEVSAPGYATNTIFDIATGISTSPSDVPSVLDYGAAPGAPAATNTAAFSAAIAAHSVVFVPGDAGTIYDLNTDTITATSSILLYGNGAKLRFTGNGIGILLYQPPSSQQRKTARITALGFVHATGSVPSSFIKNDGFLNPELDHLSFADATATYCILNESGYGASIHHNVMSDITGSAILLKQNVGFTDFSNATSIEHCDITRTSVDGIVAQGVYSLTVAHTVLESCAGTALKLSTATQPSKEITLQNVWFESNGADISCATDGSTYACYIAATSCNFSNLATIALGALGDLILLNCRAELSGQVSITGSAGARVRAINSPGFFASGNFNFYDHSGNEGRHAWGGSGAETLPLSVNAGDTGPCMATLFLHRQTSSGDATAIAEYKVRFGYSGNNFATAKIYGDDGGIGAGASDFTFAQSGGFLTVQGAGAGNYSLTWQTSGSYLSV